MALASRDEVIPAESLEERQQWERIGSGGFGQVYKVRHKDWCFPVAVKILRRDASHFMFGQTEARFMAVASYEFVLKLYGVYEGPRGERGLVTEFMERGSIQTLQEKLGGPPPWPLAFRFAQQTALAMNFLHVHEIVHLDLKPSNILLDKDLNVRLADFGLSTVSMSVVGRVTDGVTGPRGTFKFMPPEAFEESYEAVRAFDVYSFGIVLWSIFSGKEPYPGRNYSDVEDMIPEGGRPGCRNNQADLLELRVDGIKDLVDLMRKCWDHNPNHRPHFKDIVETTESLYTKHRDRVPQAVLQVLMTLDSPNQPQEFHLQTWNQHRGAQHASAQSSDMKIDQVPEGSDSGRANSRTSGPQLNDVVDNLPILSAASAQGEKAKFVDDHMAELIQEVTRGLAIAETMGVGPGKMVHRETYNRMENGISQDRIRVLYRETLNSGGEKVKAAFYDALKYHEAPLMEKLGQ